jgi:pimeloyl-ACP methyl ester carboxylesterase
MKSHTVSGGGGVHLHVVEAGDPRGRPILFLHGLSQCWLTWQRQLSSDLAEGHRLVAMDLRGHGLSDRPAEGYADSAVWAEDVRAVIETLELERPVLCGWSYGPLVILDYIRHCGDGRLGGIVFVGGVTKLGSPEAMAVLTPEFLSLVPGFFSTEVSESVASLDGLLRLCFLRAPSPEELYLMLGYEVSVPPWVRQALLSRPIDNDDLLPTIRTSVLLVHGAADRVVSPAVTTYAKAGIAQVQVSLMDNAGHAAFWDDAPAFNHRLRRFCQCV